MAPIKTKICGLRTEPEVRAAATAGTDYIGFNLFARSPRSVTPDALRTLAQVVPPGVVKVALVVNPDAAMLDVLGGLPIDMVQLHGSESPARVAEVRAALGLPVMKAVGIATAADVPALADYGRVADMLLVDAKAPKGATLPGGNGVVFDWQLIAGRRWPVPWLLAGGLVPESVAEAVRLTGAPGVDVSSGVESAPGVKDPAKVAAFCAAAQAINA